MIQVATSSPIQTDREDSLTPNTESFSVHNISHPIPSQETSESQNRRYSIVQEPPSWIPDNLAPRCMACGALFTVVRRRHHCRNCGKVTFFVFIIDLVFLFLYIDNGYRNYFLSNFKKIIIIFYFLTGILWPL